MKPLFVALCAVFIFSATFADAAESPWSSTAEMQAKILSGHSTIPADGKLGAALQTRLAPGWHSYWRNPGESGLPPRLVLKEDARNIEAITMHFPAPKRYDEMGLTTFGYEGEVTYPLDIMVKDPSKSAQIKASLETMACMDICIPVSLPLEISLEAGDGKPSSFSRVIDFARSKIPSKNKTNLKIDNITLTKEAVVITAYSKNGFDHADLFVELGDFALTEKPDFSKAGNNAGTAIVTIPIPASIQNETEFTAGALPYSRQSVIATLSNGRDAVEFSMISQ